MSETKGIKATNPTGGYEQVAARLQQIAAALGAQEGDTPPNVPRAACLLGVLIADLDHAIEERHRRAADARA